jgi:hypothetical protein
MVRWPTHRKRKARPPIPRLQSIVEAGLTTTYAISIATGISEKEIGLLMVGRIEPTDEQCEILNKLLKNYKVAIKFVNVETIKGRL